MAIAAFYATDPEPVFVSLPGMVRPVGEQLTPGVFMLRSVNSDCLGSVMRGARQRIRCLQRLGGGSICFLLLINALSTAQGARITALC